MIINNRGQSIKKYITRSSEYSYIIIKSDPNVYYTQEAIDSPLRPSVRRFLDLKTRLN